MKNKSIIASFMFAFLFLMLGKVFAHCDTLDGPVVKAAQKALETGNVDLVLIWVQDDDEAAIKEAFTQTLAVRKLSVQAQDLADRYFFETLVRVHRAGEGASYTGLKPAGLDLGPAIPAVDKALETSSLEPLLKLLSDAMQEAVSERFKEVMAKKDYSPDDVQAGREYIKAYVEFLHYIEGIYKAVTKAGHNHSEETEEAASHKE
jgi:hypothetical protein